MSSQGARSTKMSESVMVLVSWRQMPARLVAVSKWKRHHVAGAPVLRWRSSSCAAFLDLLHRCFRPWAGLDELESGVVHAPSAGLASRRRWLCSAAAR
jgi:hypothetical protein